MKVKQNGTIYSTTTFSSKYTSPSLGEKTNGVIKYTPLVEADGSIEIDGTTYSYDSSLYPKIGSRFNGKIYYAVNSTGEFVLKPVAYQPSATATYTLYSNNPNLTIGTNRKSWNSDIRQGSLGKTVQPMLLTSGTDWTPDETYCEKLETTDTSQKVVYVKAVDYTGFSFADISVVPNGDTEKAIKLVWIHMSLITTKPVIFCATIWNGGEQDYVVKVDPVNNKAYYGGQIASSPHTISWEEITLISDFTKDANGWYDINIPISVVMDSVDYSNKMYALTFLPDPDDTTNTNKYYLDNLYLYEAYKSVAELKISLKQEIDEAQDLLDKAVIGTEPGQYPQSAVDALTAEKNSATEVYNEGTSRDEIAASILSMATAIETFKNSIISDLMPDTTHDLTYITTISSSSANYASSSNGAVATASSTVQAAMLAIDGKAGTRWESNSVDPTWFMVDMGQSRTFNRIGIGWETACGEIYTFSYSDDGETWTDINPSANNSDGKLNIIYSTSEKTARYIKLTGTKRHTGYGYSIFEFFVADSNSDEWKAVVTE